MELENKYQRVLEDAQPFVESDIAFEDTGSGGCDGCCSGTCGTSDACQVVLPEEN